jgi:hypothetical protein
MLKAQEQSAKAQQQTLETLINEEALLLAKYLRGETQSWSPRVVYFT